MEPSELHRLVFACLGPRPSIGAREATVGLLKGARVASLRYEWVVDWVRLNETVVEHPAVLMSDGAEWITLALA